MSSRDHYVSQFHLRGFTDPAARAPQEPWLWVGHCTTQSIERRAPKNVGWATDMFSGAGGLANREATMESYLPAHVEGPAAFALRSFASRPSGQRRAIPAEIGRYLAWAAARGLLMKQLYQAWIDELFEAVQEAPLVEAPQTGFEKIAPVTRIHRMEHPVLGTQDDVPSEQVDLRRREGWRFLLGRDDLLELVHLQAWYFQVRFFPRLRWIIVDAPPGWHFIIGDRPVVWGFDGIFDARPSALRHPHVQLFATLTRSVAVFAYNPAGTPPDAVPVRDVNRIIALAPRIGSRGQTDTWLRRRWSIGLAVAS